MVINFFLNPAFVFQLTVPCVALLYCLSFGNTNTTAYQLSNFDKENTKLVYADMMTIKKAQKVLSPETFFIV